MSAPRAPLDARQLHFVTGKGGVGKSVIACALAQRFVDDGHRTLLCQVNAQDSHGALLGTAAIDEELRAASPRLTVVNIRPDAALHEYAGIVLRFDTLVRTLLENRVARAFLRFVPSLSELTMLGKIWYHAEERADGRPRFDRIVVDAPSTGHGLGFLKVARVVHDATAGIGPMAEKTAEMQRTLTDPTRAALHVVTLPEEMPANETLELIAAAREDALPPLGFCIVNLVTPPLFSAGPTRALLDAESRRHGVEDDDDALSTAPLAAYLAAGRRRARREAQEARELARLDPRALALPVLHVPSFRDVEPGPALVRAVAAAIAPARAHVVEEAP